MGVFPRTAAGARSLLADSARIAVLGGAQRLIVKTEAEAHRIPTVAENLTALTAAARQAAVAREEGLLPDRHQVDHSVVLDEARRLVHAVLELSDDVGQGLVAAFASGLLDVPYCLHADNAGLARGGVDVDGRLYWARTGNLPLPARAAGPARPVTSGNLLRMLNHTADRHDRQALAAPSEPPAPAGEPAQRVAVIGSGPRGLSVVERLAARAAETPDGGPVEVWLIDDVEVGCGRIWRTDQSPWLLMNTAAGEVSMFSGGPDAGPARAGAGPSLGEWWATVDPGQADPDGYAPRAVYGRYLRYVLDRVEENLPRRMTLHRVLGRVDDVRRGGSARWSLRLLDGRELDVDRVALTTGHPRSEPPAEHRRLAAFAAERPDLRYISGDSTADLPLADIPSGAEVGVVGLGLSFYDVLAELTLGRGGRFVDDGPGGRLRYVASGREPVLVAGSRGGVPLRARGRNQ
jgi:methylaspartate mutase epsilon subunit